MEFKYTLTNLSLELEASDRVAKFLNPKIKNPVGIPNVITKTIKGSGNTELEFTKPEGIK